MNDNTQAHALGRVTVLDLTRVRAGPACVRQFGDWGAKVIKVEARPDSKGAAMDFAGRHEADFQNLHRNKRSITLDLKVPDGVRILKRLAETADVVVENFRPEVKFRLGIDYESLRKINPRLIYASISGFGQDGPYKERPGLDQIAQGMSGLMSVTGEPGRGPMRVGTALADLSSGIFAALGILVALYERETSGVGQWVQSSLLHAQIFMLDFQAARYTMSGDVPVQVGNGHPTAVPGGTYAASDGVVNLFPMPTMWRRFCMAIEREDLIEHPDYSTLQLRRLKRKELDAAINQFTRKLDRATLIERMNAAGIPCGPIYTIDQTFADPQVRHLGVAQTVVSKTLGPISLISQPVKLSRTPARIESAAPEAGEHTDEILGELGYAADEIERFRAQGVV